MAINRPSDSMSRCDPSLYSNIYDVRKRSDIKHEPIYATQPTHKDTIEISRDKLKEEALSRLRHTSKYVIIQNSFARIGKYLFIAIAFPPYFILYGLPKWIIVEGLPAILSMYMWVWKKVQQKTKNRFDAGIHKVVQLTQFMQKMAQHVLIQPIIRVILEFRQRILRMRENIHQTFKQIYEKSKKIFNLPGVKVSEGLKRLQIKLAQVRKSLQQQVETVATRVQESFQWIKQSPLLFLGWGQTQIQKFNEQAVSWRNSWKQRIQTSQQMAQRTTNWISKQYKQGLEKFKRTCEPLTSFFASNWLCHGKG